jgi:hypothetical protein
MTLTNLQRQWQHAAEKRGLKVTIPFAFALRDGWTIQAEVLLEDYGARRGMLIVSDFAAIADQADAIVAAGFGYSSMSEPCEAEISALEAIDAALEDWGATTLDL